MMMIKKEVWCMEIDDMYDKSWRQDYLNNYSHSLPNKWKELLNEGAKSLSQSWILQALHYDWKRKKGYKEPPEIDCSSSYKEWEESIKKHSI